MVSDGYEEVEEMKKITALFLVIILSVSAACIIYAEKTGSNKTPTLRFHTGFHDVGTFYYGLAPAKDENEKLGYIDLEGNVVIDYQYDTAINYTDMQRNADYRPASPAPYNSTYKSSEAFSFIRGYAGVYLNDSLLYINTKGERIDNTFSGRYYFAGPFVNGRALAQKVKNGLFGYIDEAGNAVTEFKYLSASHFKNGVASVQLAVPFKNGESKYLPPNITMTTQELDELYPVRAMFMPKDMDIIDLYIDTDGSVLSWKFHEQDMLDESFRTGVIYGLGEVSQGLILKENRDADPPVWYEYPDGTTAITFDKSLNVYSATPFTKENIAKVFFHKGEGSFTGYCNTKGEILDDELLKKEYPNLYRDFAFPLMYEDETGPFDSVVIKEGKKYLVENETTAEIDIQKLQLKVYLVDSDGSIVMDCTNEVVSQFKEIYSKYWNVSVEEANRSINSGMSIWLSKSVENSNIYYIGIRKSMRTYEYLGFVIVEGWE